MDQIIRFCCTMLVVVVLVTAAAAAAATTTTSVRTSTSTRVSSSKVISTTENETETTSQSNPPRSLIYYQTKQSTKPTPTKLTLTAENETETTSQSNPPKSQPMKKFVHVPGNCPLGMVWREGNQVIMLATLMKGTGAAFARTSCLSRGARPLFLNTQQDADLLHRILRDCDKSDRLGGVWVPVRRHQQLKKVTYSQKAAWMTGSSNSITANTWEFDWLNAKFDWYTGNVMLHPFPKDVTVEGIICIKN